jgi:hypothetical protein
MIGAYGWIYETWAMERDEGSFAVALKSALRDHAIRNGVIPENEPALGIFPKTKVISLAGAATILGFGVPRARCIAIANDLVPRGVRRGVAMPLDAERIAFIKNRQERTVDGKGLRALLGAGRRITKRLIDAGILLPTKTEDEVPIRFSVAVIDEFLATLAKGAPIRRSDPAASLSLVFAARYYDAPIDVLCQGIFNGSMRICGVRQGRLSLASLLVYRKDVQRLRQRMDLTVEDTALELNIHHESARDLIRLGLLRSRKRARRGHHHIARQDVESFKRRYVSGSEVARQLGTSSQNARKRLNALSVFEVVAPPACRQIIYARSAVSKRVLQIARR